uniref:Plant heme peroxidase family profile domain-containing protein n=1 Tax=Triticum urartu TaxID=4572 RepID=A0A8R7UJD5_TRIUA
VVVLGLATDSQAQLRNGFYTGKCRGNDVEAVVRGIIKARFAQDSAIIAHLLRLLFHECDINGCDDGLLIDGTGTEKMTKPNLSMKGYDLITNIKTELEKRCPGVVSCSNIEILATRDVV